MNKFISEDAKLAVKKGISWLDENHPNWANFIDLEAFDMAECSECIIGQAIGDYSRIIASASNCSQGEAEAVLWSVDHGFESPSAPFYMRLISVQGDYGYEELDTLWSDEVRKRLG